MRETMDRLSGAQNRLRNASMVLLAALAVSVILILMKIRIPGLVLGTAAMVLYFGWVKWQSRKYSTQVTEANILYGLAADLEDPKYLGKKGLTVEELDQAAILPVQVEKGSLLIFQGFEGKMEGSLIRGWETKSASSLCPLRTAESSSVSSSMEERIPFSLASAKRASEYTPSTVLAMFISYAAKRQPVG